jgi:hypothetical protein
LRPVHRCPTFGRRLLVRIPLEGRFVALPRLAGVTRARYRLLGANTPL